MRWLLKRWWFLGGAAFMLVAVCAGYLLIPVERARITQENCDKIEVGWSPEQVVSLLGQHYVPDKLAGRPGTRITAYLDWRDEDGNRIAIEFVIEVGIEPLHVEGKEFVPTTLSFFERMKGRIERRIRALWP